jgi:hypothetical protein
LAKRISCQTFAIALPLLALATAPAFATTREDAVESVEMTLLMTWDCAIAAEDLGEVQAELGLADAAFKTALDDMMTTGKLALANGVYRLNHEECV